MASSRSSTPIQPTSSQLPLETLSSIYSFVLFGLSPHEARQQRLRFALVSHTWHLTAGELCRDLVVFNAGEAGRAAKCLDRAGKGDRVRSVDLTIARGERKKSKEVSALLEICTTVEEVTLRTANEGSIMLAKGIYQALASLGSSLNKLDFFDCPSHMKEQELVLLLSSLPSLTTLLLARPLIGLNLPQYPLVVPPPLAVPPSLSLTRLAISPVFGNYNASVLLSLISSPATSASLRHLDLGCILLAWWSTEKMTPEVITGLVIVAPQLESFRFLSHAEALSDVGAEGQFRPILEALRDVRSLELGMEVVRADEIFPLLQKLNLRNLTHLQLEDPTLVPLHENRARSDQALLWLESANTGKGKLRNVRLPTAEELLWSVAEKQQLEEMVRGRNVKLEWGEAQQGFVR